MSDYCKADKFITYQMEADNNMNFYHEPDFGMNYYGAEETDETTFTRANYSNFLKILFQRTKTTLKQLIRNCKTFNDLIKKLSRNT